MKCFARLILAATICVTLPSCVLFQLPLRILQAVAGAATLAENKPQRTFRYDQSDLKTGSEATPADSPVITRRHPAPPLAPTEIVAR